MKKDWKKVLLESIILIVIYGILMLSLNPLLEMIPYLKENTLIKDLVNGIIMSTILILYLIYLKKLNIIKIDGKKIIKGLLVSMPLILFFSTMAITIYNDGLKNGLQVAPIGIIVLNLLAIIIAAGFTEEVLFRGIIFNNFLDCFGRNSRKGVLISIAIASGLFGLVHLSNIFQGADLASSVFMASVSLFSGAAFAAIYVRTKSIWPGIIVHSLMDIMGGAETIFFNKGSMMDRGVASQSTNAFFPVVLMGSIFLIYALFILRKKKSKEYLQNND